MTETHRTDVLVVGAGPTGLALAIGLQQKSIDHIIIDKEMHGHNTSRAAVIHAHTLEMLEQLGVSKILSANGLKLAKFTMRDRDRALLQLRFDSLSLADHLLPVKHRLEMNLSGLSRKQFTKLAA